MAVRGAGELGSAVARLLFRCGVPVWVLERPEPLAVRRLVSFSEAVHRGEARVEGVVARRLDAAAVAGALERPTLIPLVVDPDGACLGSLRPAALVDARMTKCAPGPRRAPVVIGLGPGFEVGRDADAVVETSRGPDLGRVLWSGSALPDTGAAAEVGGVSDRVIRAPREGRFRGEASIGDLVEAGQRVGSIDGVAVEAPVAGLLRGLLADGVLVEAGVKLGDVDPRGAVIDAARVSDKGRVVAAGALEALLALWRGGAGGEA